MSLVVGPVCLDGKGGGATSNLFDAGHRIRVTVTGADRANSTTPEQKPPPRLVLHREDGRASHIVLPIVPAR